MSVDTDDTATDDDSGFFDCVGAFSFDGDGEDCSFLGDNDSGQDLANSYFAALSKSQEMLNNNESQQLAAVASEEAAEEIMKNKTIRFADDVKFANENSNATYYNFFHTNTKEESSMESSISSDKDGTDSSLEKVDSLSCASTVDSDSNENDDDEDDSCTSVDPEKEQERQIVRSLAFAGVGAGFMAALGWGIGRLMNRTSSVDASDANIGGSGAEQLVGGTEATGGVSNAASTTTTSTTTAQQASSSSAALQMNASMTASQGNMSTLGNGFYVPPSGMEGAQ